MATAVETRLAEGSDVTSATEEAAMEDGRATRGSWPLLS